MEQDGSVDRPVFLHQKGQCKTYQKSISSLYHIAVIKSEKECRKNRGSEEGQQPSKEAENSQSEDELLQDRCQYTVQYQSLQKGSGKLTVSRPGKGLTGLRNPQQTETKI